MNTSFLDTLAYFKSQERPEAILCVGDDTDLIKIAVIWPNIPIRPVVGAPSYPANGTDVRKWNWLWSCVKFKPDDIAAGLGSRYLARTKLDALITNRILYPDGTLHSYMTRYLRDRVIKMFETRTKKAGAKKA